MTDYIATSADLTTVADAIRTKGGTSAPLVFPNGFATAIDNIPTGTPTLETKSKTYTATESQQTDQITPSVGYDGLDKVNVTVNAIPSNYVGSGITQRTSTDLSASGATVTAPAGYYASNATKSVASGTAGTPTATKSAVSNHSLTVTPSVTNTTGYITGSTKTGTAVSVSASELVSGTLTVASSGTKDVTNYASASIPEGSATPSATKGTVSNHSVSVTPSVTSSAGWINTGLQNGPAVTVTASELDSGTKSISANGTGIDVVGYAAVDVNVTKTYTATITSTGSSSYAYVRYPSATGTKYYTAGDTFDIEPDEEIYIYAYGSRGGATIYVNDVNVASTVMGGKSYNYTTKKANVSISLEYSLDSTVRLVEDFSTVTITTNGTHDVSDYDYADVNVTSLVLTDTFTTPTSAGQYDITVPYSGNGYPVQLSLFLQEGASNSSGDFYNTDQQYAVAASYLHKNDPTLTPTYIGNTDDNRATVLTRYKTNSTGPLLSTDSNTGRTSYVNTGALNSLAGYIIIKSKNVFSVYVAASSYGLMKGVDYIYTIVYSS